MLLQTVIPCIWAAFSSAFSSAPFDGTHRAYLEGQPGSINLGSWWHTEIVDLIVNG